MIGILIEIHIGILIRILTGILIGILIGILMGILTGILTGILIGILIGHLRKIESRLGPVHLFLTNVTLALAPCIFFTKKVPNRSGLRSGKTGIFVTVVRVDPPVTLFKSFFTTVRTLHLYQLLGKKGLGT